MIDTAGQLAAPDGAQRVPAPSALAGDPRRFVSLTRTLAVTDFKLRFYGSALGYLWQLMRPLLLFGVLYLVFTHVAKFGRGVPFYPAVLLMGIVLYTFLNESTNQSVTSVVERENLVRKIHFPRLVIPVAAVATAALNLLLNFVAVLVFMLASGVRPHWTWLELPAILLALLLLSGGLSMLLSSLYVRFRDVKPIWEVCLQMLFYASPIFYPIERAPAGLSKAIMLLNPFADILVWARHAIIDPTAPTPEQVLGSYALLLIPMGIVIGLCAVGFWYFDRSSPHIAEEL